MELLLQNQRRSPCDICGSAETEAKFVAEDRLASDSQIFTISQCVGCGVLRTFPEMSDIELAQFYPEEYWGEGPSGEWIVKSQSEKKAFLEDTSVQGGRILDVGCGSGYFLRALDGVLWDRFGVETGQAAVEAARKHLGDKNVVEGGLEDSQFDNESFDVITFWSSLEHINHPRAALVEAHRILKPTGKLIIQLPNAESYQSRLFKGNWFALDVPRHRYHFSEKVLRRFLKETGFAIGRMTCYSREHNSHALRQSLKSKLSIPVVGRAAYLLIKPFTTPVDTFISNRGHGATITLVARKT